jgi:hypothetical protein
MGAGASIVTYPIADGKLLNVAAFVYVLAALPFVSQQLQFHVPDMSPRRSSEAATKFGTQA